MPPQDLKGSVLYLEWTRLNAPDWEPAALGLVDALDKGIGRTYGKPGRFLDELGRRARELPPEHLPWFWDTVAQRLSAPVPRHAATAYGRARAAETEHALPVDKAYRLRNALLFAEAGALTARELRDHRQWLAAAFPAGRAHEEFVRFVLAWNRGGGVPAADLLTRLRASAKDAGVAMDEVARLLGDVLAEARGKAVPGGLLDGAAKLFATHPPAPEALAGLAAMFPTGKTDGSAWLRVLDASGAAAAMADGTVTPTGGLAGWLGRFTHTYNHVEVAYGGIAVQPMPAELLGLVPRLAPRLRAEGVPVRLWESRFRTTNLDADLADACLAEGVPVEDPAGRARLTVRTGESRRDLNALAAHPTLGKVLERTVGSSHRRGTAITRLPGTAAVEKSVHERISRLIEEVATAGLETAGAAMDDLDARLDPPTAAALDGIEEALEALDLAGPLARTLRAGLPAELGWPGLEEAVAELTASGGAVEGVTSTWPVLTAFTRTRAIAVDHRGRRAACAFTIPEDATRHSVHYVGGDFLVAWSTGDRYHQPGHAFWASEPGAVFAPEETLGLDACFDILSGAQGYQFETADGGRHDGQRVLRRGGREGIGDHEFQMTDGDTVWSNRVQSREKDPWAAVDPVTGARAATGSLPAFFASAPPPEGMVWDYERLSLVRLPDGVDSPLGQAGGLSGFRVTHPDSERRAEASHHVVEGADGRRGTLPRGRRRGGYPWGIVRMPEGGADLVVTHGTLDRYGPMRSHDAEDGTVLWEVRSYPSRKEWLHSALGGTIQPDPQNRRMFPPPAFWHFLLPRDPGSSRALRDAGESAARALLEAAGDGDGQDDATVRESVRAALARVLPGVTEPEIVEDVVAVTVAAARARWKREAASRRIAAVRSGERVRPSAEATDADLLVALRGLLDVPHTAFREESARQPATVTAVAADGRFLRGEIGELLRRVSPPARPQDWTGLLGRIDAAAWRLVAPSTPNAERATLAALLHVWSEQPFAAPGRWRRGTAEGAALEPLCAAGQAMIVAAAPAADQRIDPGAKYRFVQPAEAPEPENAADIDLRTVTRDDSARIHRLLELLDEKGPLPLDPAAIAAFSERAGVRRAMAVLAFDGLPRKRLLGTDYVPEDENHTKMLRGKPYQASKAIARAYEDLSYKLGTDGRRRLVAAAMPDDPAELWADGGTVAAAERMAGVWVELLGAGVAVDEDTAAELERELSLDAARAADLADPSGSVMATSDMRMVVAANRYGSLGVHHLDDDGSPGRRVRGNPYTTLATLLVWALTERPVGTPATAGVPELHRRLRARMDAPGLLLPLGTQHLGGNRAAREHLFGPGTHPALPYQGDDPFNDAATGPVAYDDGLFIVDARSDRQVPALRPSALGDPGRYEQAVRLCEDHDLPGLLWALRHVRVLHGGGLARMVERSLATPVPAGGYEADPLLSVPELVDEAAGELGTDRDAAALYLQLLTLARPTDRNVRKWNGWGAARHKAAQAKLVERGVVQQDKRPRAGRTAFVPGAWTEIKAPELPLESAKLETHLATVNATKELEGPFFRLLPPAPLHELFATAWAAR
ncbi:hypothetical protein [Actinomadura sp. KC345]|uniref:hypothetical protein n=1 Tax=Actinomadura sp. KC345 TaxID=2530371 RepID=UPI001A9D05B7|nr:hypothetical protein [Actinomadura sp. KC345]